MCREAEMQRFVDTAVRKTMNAVFDVGATGIASIGFVLFAIVLYYFDVI